MGAAESLTDKAMGVAVDKPLDYTVKGVKWVVGVPDKPAPTYTAIGMEPPSEAKGTEGERKRSEPGIAGKAAGAVVGATHKVLDAGSAVSDKIMGAGDAVSDAVLRDSGAAEAARDSTLPPVSAAPGDPRANPHIGPGGMPTGGAGGVVAGTPVAAAPAGPLPGPPLPAGWTWAVDGATGVTYFLNHDAKTTQWQDPRTGTGYTALDASGNPVKTPA